jgi:hypothetical protein
VFDEFGGLTLEEATGRYAIWGKTNIANYDSPTQEGSVKTTKYSAMAGVDGSAIQLDGLNTKFIPTVYAAVIHRNLGLHSYHAMMNEYVGGAKAAWFDDVKSTELQASYSYSRFKTKDHPELGLNARSHTVSTFAKFGYNMMKLRGVLVRPEIVAGYSFVHLSKARSATDSSVKLNDLHRISLRPGVNFILRRDTFNVSTSISYLRQFGTKSKVTYSPEVITDADKIKHGYLECAANIEKNFSNNLKLGMKLSKAFGRRKGIQGSLSVSIMNDSKKGK